MTTADRVTVDTELTGSGETHISTRMRTVGDPTLRTCGINLGSGQIHISHSCG
jgi:hypothetical protein